MIRDRNSLPTPTFLLFHHFQHYSSGQLIPPKLQLHGKAHDPRPRRPAPPTKHFSVDSFFKQSFHHVPLETTYHQYPRNKTTRKNTSSTLKPLRRMLSSRKTFKTTTQPQQPLMLASSFAYQKMPSRISESQAAYFTIQPTPVQLPTQNVPRTAVHSFRVKPNRRTQTESGESKTNYKSNDICEWATLKDTNVLFEDNL